MSIPPEHSRFQYRRFSSQSVVVLLLIGVLLFAAGFWSGQRSSVESGETRLRQAFERAFLGSTALDPSLLETVVEKIQQKYILRPADDRKLLYGAAVGLVESLGDPYSAFFPPEESQFFQEEINGKFEGVGIEIGIRDGMVTIISPLEGSPAQAAGVQAGDVLLAIDDESALNMSVDDAVSRIRGEKGSTVVLTVGRGDDVHDISIVRDTITVASVHWELKPFSADDARQYAEITLSSFNSDTDREFAEAVSEVLRGSPSAILLDIRNNPGGFLDTAIAIAGHFIGEEVVVIESYGEGNEQEYRSTQRQTFSGLPVAVLVNGGTASAAEILAGALQDFGVAEVIGKQTFGKGTVQEFETLTGGASLKLTVAQWLTPKGREIEGVGLTPDRLVERTEEDYTDGRDPQAQAAIQYFIQQLDS